MIPFAPLLTTVLVALVLHHLPAFLTGDRPSNSLDAAMALGWIREWQFDRAMLLAAGAQALPGAP